MSQLRVCVFLPTQSVTRDVVVEGIAGLNIAVTPVFNCYL